MSRPVLVAVDDDPGGLSRVADELERRYAADYRILRAGSFAEARAALRSLRERDEEVALLLTSRGGKVEGGCRTAGEELLGLCRELFPGARRGLLIEWGEWGDPETAEVVFRAMALGHIDYYVLKPWRSPDEYFHRTVTEFLNEWSRSEDGQPREATLVAEQWSPRGHELRDLLARNGVPHIVHDAASEEGREILEAAGHRPEDGPLLLTVDGHVLVDPTNADVARAFGVTTELGPDRDFDVVVVGAGPAGLSAGVYGASEGLRTLVVEAEALGGQAGSSSRIRNYLGFSRGVSGSELAQRAYQQAWVFGTRFLLMRRVTALRIESGRRVLSISDGSEATARAVILATGVTYRRIGIPGLEALTGAGVFYGASAAEAKGLAGEEVYVIGGGNSAGQAAAHLARYAERVILLVRGPSLAESMSQYLVDELGAAPNVEVRLNTEVVDGGGTSRLEWLALRLRGGDDEGGAGGGAPTEPEVVPAAAVFVMIGAHPHTDWLPDSIRRDEWGYLLTGEDLGTGGPGTGGRRPLPFETSLSGVFAVGDVRHRSVKRVASAVGEGSVAIAQVHRYLSERDRRVPA